MKRIADKDEIHRQLLHKKHIEHLKKVENVRLHTIDVEQTQSQNRNRKQQLQEYLLQKEYKRRAFNLEVLH